MKSLDPYFQTNMENAESVGLKAGVCFYGEAETVQEARKEAAYVLDIVKDCRVSYPISYDVQALADTRMTKRQITDVINAFCQVIEDAGYRAAVFGDYEWLTRYVDMKEMPYDVWYSRYGIANSFQNRTLWRCTDSGRSKASREACAWSFRLKTTERPWRVPAGGRSTERRIILTITEW